MEAHRLRAPTEDGGILAQPLLEEVPARIAENQRALAEWDHDFQGRKSNRLRSMARRQVLDRARRHHDRFGLDFPDVSNAATGPILVTGHQAELFHPGVWAKNFSMAGLAGATRALGINLVVDNDVPRGPAIRVPTRDGDRLRVVHVPFDSSGGEVPYEDWTVQDESLFETFPDRAREALSGLVSSPVADALWPAALAARAVTDRAGLRFAVARRRLEADWGVHNVEVPLSALCETEAFLWFVCHLLARLEPFQVAHNSALIAYRRLYGVRSTHHPVPALTRQEEWLEAPFWVWRAEDPRRRPLLARHHQGRTWLRAQGEDQPFLELPLGPDREACCAVERLLELPSRGIRLRSRALTTTMFSRLVLGDLFIHGIGGAKYDELGDEVIRRFFGLMPPAYLALSMTVWPMPDATAVNEHDRIELVHRERELDYNPERVLPRPWSSETAALVQAKWDAINGPTATRRERVHRFREIRRCNVALAAGLDAERRRLAERASVVQRDLADAAIAHGRDFALVVHDETRLHQAMNRAFQAGIVVPVAGNA